LSKVQVSHGQLVQPTAGVSPAQLPATHRSCTRQAVVQPPQCLGSVERSAHAPAHAIVPDGHAAAHWPPAHTWPMGHALPQLEQLPGSLVVSTHPPSQEVSPVRQVHCPATHAVNAGHEVVQEPQWALSRCRSKQPLEQLVVPAGQSHAPASQKEFVAQRLQVLPQCWRSSVTSQHLPSPQALVGLSVHAPTHWPASHFCPAAQAWAQSPQLAGSLCTSRHDMLHCFCPVGHVHWPARQPEPTVRHGWRQVPQEIFAWLRSAQKAAQNVSGASQAHCPLLQCEPPGQV
jgi:hypothetical protein